MTLENIRIRNGGYCLQLARLVGAKSWRVRRFQAVFITFHHPTHGTCLIDTGYGPALRQATSTVAGRLSSWLLPVPAGQPFEEPDYLRRAHGLQASDVQLVFLSHFHADHAAGIGFFPNATFVYRNQSLNALREMPWSKQLQHAYIAPLLAPLDACRSNLLCETRFLQRHDQFVSIPTLDYFGDGSLILLDLPGHALGHTGYLLQGSDGSRMLYAVDAFWDVEVWRSHGRLPWLIHRGLPSVDDYYQTHARLHELSKSLQLTPVACHCPRTQAVYVQPPTN